MTHSTLMILTIPLTIACCVLIASTSVFRSLIGLLIYFTLYPAFVPFQEVRLAIAGSTVSIGMGGIIQIIILIIGGIVCFTKGNRSFKEIRGLNICFIAFILWLIISMFVNSSSLDMLASSKELGRITSMYMLFLIAYKHTDGVNDIKRFLISLFASLPIPVIFGLWQIFHGTRYVELENYNRIEGTFGIPNVFAAYLLLPITIFLVLALSRSNNLIKRIVCGLMSVSLLVMLFFTYSRASWVGCIVSVLYIGIKKYRRLLIYAIGISLALIIGLTIEELRLGQSGSSGRLNLWISLLLGAKDWVFGVGLTDIGDLTKKLLNFKNSGQNQYLLYLVEGGVPACILFILLMHLLYRKLAKIILSNRDDIYKDLILAIKAYVLSQLAVAFFESTPIFQIYFWVPCGVFIGAIMEATSVQNRMEPCSVYKK